MIIHERSLMKLFGLKHNDKKTSSSQIFPEDTFQSVKKPKGDILYNVIDDHLSLTGCSSGWLVAFDRTSNSFCQADRVHITDAQVSQSDLIRLMQSVEPLSDISRIRLCLYLPEKKAVHYLKGTPDGETQFARYFLLDPRPILHIASHRYIYTSDGGLLSVGLAAKLFKPKNVFYITPADVIQPNRIVLPDSADIKANETLYYGIYNKSEQEMFPVQLTDNTISLSDIIEKCPFLRAEITDTYYLCLIRTGAEVVCNYLTIAAPPSMAEPDTYNAIPLDNRYNALITEPEQVPGHGYIALTRMINGSITIQSIEAEHLDKYHNTLLSEDLPVLHDASLFLPFDAEDDVDPSSFFHFIDASINALSQTHMTKSQNFQLQKRIVFNLSGMLDKAADITSKYATDEPAYTDEWKKLRSLMQMIDDDIIMQSLGARYIKLFLLNSKYQRACDQEEHIGNILLKYGDTSVFSIGTMYLRIDIIEITDQTLIIEGYLRHPDKAIIDETLELVTYINGTSAPNTIIPRYSDRYIYGCSLSKDLGFKLTVPLTEDRYNIAFGVKTHGFVSMCSSIEYTNTSPVNNKLKNGYFVCDNYVITSSRNRLYCQRYYDEETLQEYEERFCTEIIAINEDRADEILALRRYYKDYIRQDHSVKKWIMIDRADRADDNAEVLFRHLVKAQYPNIEPIFILSKDSPQFEELSELGTVYDFHSEEHLKAILTCEYVFSSQMAPSTTNPFNEDYDFFRDIIRKKHFVFLQHGVTHNDNGNAFSRYARNFYGIVVNANDEYNYMLTPEFNNPRNSIWLTGMPRFDMLHDDNKRMITIMPTWRKSLTSRIFDEEKGTNVWAVSDAFADSEYFNFYNSLINDPRVVNAAKAHNYTIFFMPHPQFMSKADLFDNTCPECISICTDDIRYRDVFAMSSLILTDYSSVVFDFAYLHKPVLYAQFDKEAFFKAHTVKPGYYNFEDHGFGEVTYNYEDTVANLVSYIENDCQMKEKYRQRVDSFFRYTDHNCCERICRKVFELEKK